MNREDVLRELELLPVWQLRAPASISAPIVAPMPVIEQASVPVETQAPQTTLRIIVSDDANYLFLLAALQSSEEEVLLQNMLKALLNTNSAKTRIDISSQGILNLNQYAPKIIIVMGEVAAQSLLNANESLENLRGKTHLHHNLPVVVTYHPSHLLANAADKAKAWADLCLAKRLVLKSVI